MNKKQRSERDICPQFIVPALKKAGWDIERQFREEVRLQMAASTCAEPALLVAVVSVQISSPEGTGAGVDGDGAAGSILRRHDMMCNLLRREFYHGHS